MKNKKQIAAMIVLLVLFMAMLAGCNKSQTPQLANERTFSLTEISDITISYDEENITFFKSDNENLIIKEYMTENKKSYYANVTERDNYIGINEGQKPFFKKNFTRYIEVYLPSTYNQNLKITTTNGGIAILELKLNLSKLRIDSTKGAVSISNATAADIYISTTDGNLDLGHLKADDVKIETTSGKVICSEIDGCVTYNTTSGNAEFKCAKGSGSYSASNSGILNIIYSEVTGDISFYNKNDNILLFLPSDLDFNFQATTKNGKIITDFEECVSTSGQTIKGVVGENPTIAVKVETKNGNIEVSR